GRIAPRPAFGYRSGRESMKSLLGLMAAVMPFAQGDTPTPTAPPPISIILGPRHGHITPSPHGFTHAGGEGIDITQPTPDTLIVPLTGAVMAGPHPCTDSVATLQIDLAQDFELVFSDPEIRRAKLTLEARVIGLLRSPSGCCKKAVGSA